MTGNKLRQQIVFEAARLLFQRQESEYAQARLRAARMVCSQRLRPSQLPTNHEIRQELQRLSSVYASAPAGEGSEDAAGTSDRFQHYRSLLVPLSRIVQNVKTHPEGDVLYHSLQVFERVRDDVPYDEDLLLAALLHDVGKGIDPRDPVGSGLRALAGTISERTAWLIENHALARNYLDGTIGIRARRRLQHSESFDELILLAKCDAAGRVPGARVPELDEALGYLRALDDADSRPPSPIPPGPR